MNFWPKSIIAVIFFIMVMSRGLVAQTPEQSASPTPFPTPQVLSISPDGKFLVRREQAESGVHGEARKSLEICTSAGAVLYSWDSGLGFTTLLWSPDSRYLAVNDMPGEQGDLVRLFALDSMKPAVSATRQPNGKKLLSDEEERHGTFLSSVDRVTLRALEWRDGQLWCSMTGSAHPKRAPMVHVPFHHLLVFSMSGSDIPMLAQEWTLTMPKEYPSCDPAQEAR